MKASCQAQDMREAQLGAVTPTVGGWRTQASVGKHDTTANAARGGGRAHGTMAAIGRSMQTEMTITRTGNGNLAPLWPDQMEEGPVTVRPAVDAYAEGWAMPWATGGAAFALAMVYECPFAYAAYYGDVGENETSDVVALADVLALLG